MSNEDPIIVFEGTQVQAEALHAMLTARGVTSAVTRDREVEGGTAPIEAMILVPPEQAEEARDLIADVASGAATRIE
ncbi:MAG: hypothetical protein M3680_26295 [Myxococcota bacterium]|nr:hypothetical protein [Myxococcota bacterium]